jgi:hypothetical protein
MAAVKGVHTRVTARLAVSPPNRQADAAPVEPTHAAQQENIANEH